MTRAEKRPGSDSRTRVRSAPRLSPAPGTRARDCPIARIPVQSRYDEAFHTVSSSKLEEGLFVGYRIRLFVLLLAAGLLAPMAVTAQVASPVPAILSTFGYRVVTEYPHDRRAFTQGLAYVDGVLYEGTGLYGESTLRRVDLETGEVLQEVGLSKEYFGEGIAVLGDRIYQLTWKNGVCVVYRPRDVRAREGLYLSD